MTLLIAPLQGFGFHHFQCLIRIIIDTIDVLNDSDEINELYLEYFYTDFVHEIYREDFFGADSLFGVVSKKRKRGKDRAGRAGCAGDQ